MNRKRIDHACGDVKKHLTSIRAMSRQATPHKGRLAQAVKALENRTNILVELLTKGK